jgi:hypothetical protein
MNTDRLLAVVFDRHLGFRVGTKVRHKSIFFLADIGEPFYELVRVHDRHRHEFGSIEACIPEHHPLVTGTSCIDTA